MNALLYPARLMLSTAFLFLVFSNSYAQYEDTRLDSIYHYQYTSPRDSLPVTKSVCSFTSFPNSSACYNFSSCIASRYDAQTRIWTPYFKSEIRLEEQGTRFSSSQFSYSWDAQKKRWIPEEQQFNQRTPAMREKAIYRWDTTFLVWNLISTIKWQYDAKGNTTLYENKNFHLQDKRWEGFKDEASFDELDRRTALTHFQWNGEKNEWVGQNRETFAYRAAGNLSKREEFFWFEELATWTLQSTETFSYNDQGQETYWEKTYRYDLGSGPIVEEKREQTYDASGNELVSTYSKLNLVTFEWQVYEHLEQSYDSQNYLISKRYTYWDWHLDTAFLKETNDYTRTADGQVETEERYGYDINGEQVYGTLNQYAYDSQQRQIDRIRSIRDLERELWVPQQKTESPYTSFGYRDFFAVYGWDEEKNSWVGKSRTSFDYNAEQITTRRTNAFWREQQGDWFVTYGDIYAFGPCKRENLLSERKGSLLIYPNPTSGAFIRIESTLTLPFTYTVLNLQGQAQLKGEMNSFINRLDISRLSGGTYILQCRSGNKVEVQKFSVARP